MARMADGGASEPRLGAMAWSVLAVDWVRENPNRPPEKAGRLYRQLPKEAPSRSPVLDLAVEATSSQPLKEWKDIELHAAIELKWTDRGFKEQAVKALRQLQNVPAKRKVVVVGAGSFLVSESTQDYLYVKLRELGGATIIESIQTQSGDALAIIAHALDTRWIMIVGAVRGFSALLGYVIADGIRLPSLGMRSAREPGGFQAREALGNDLGQRLLDRLEEYLKPWWGAEKTELGDSSFCEFALALGEEYVPDSRSQRSLDGGVVVARPGDEESIDWLGLLQAPWSSLAAGYLRLVQKSVRRERWRELVETHVRVLLQRIERPLPVRLSARGTVSPMPIRLGIRRNGRLLTRYGRSALTMIVERTRRASNNPREALLVMGPAGIGKTTVLEAIFKSWIEEALLGGEIALLPLIPVWLDVQEMSDSDLASLDSGEIGPREHQQIIEFLVLNAAARAHFGESSGSKMKAFPGLSSVLQIAPLIVVIDGWDQIASKPLLRKRVIRLLHALAGETFSNVRKIVLSSRPSLEVAEVLRAAIGGRRRWTMTPLWLDKPDDQSRQIYIEEWFAFATTPLEREDRRRNLWNWDSFSQWFDRSFSEDRGVARWHREALAGRVQANPLLLTLALIVYFERTHRDVGPNEVLKPFEHIAELFEVLFERLNMSDESAQRFSAPVANRRDIPLPFSIYEPDAFRPRLEVLCFETLTGTRAAVGALVPSALLDSGDTVASRLVVLKDRLARLGWPSFSSLPFIFNRDVIEGETWEFIHPLFHEYFAACHAASTLLLSAGNESPAGSLTVASDAPAENADTGLGQVFLKLGREGFQLLLSRLLLTVSQRNKPNLSELASRTLRHMANVLSRDLTIQQYLYDTGFIDVAASELYEWLRLVEDRESSRQVTAEARIAMQKLVAHYHYGTKDGEIEGRVVGRRLGLEMMSQAIEAAARASSDDGSTRELLHWYKNFFEDHILNRQPVFSEPGSTQLGIEKEWEAFKPEAVELSDIMTKKASGSASSFSLLRAAHFFGHRANHALIWFSQASQNRVLGPEIAATTFDFGVRAAERAIVLRLAALSISNEGLGTLKRIAEITDTSFVTGAVAHALLQSRNGKRPQEAVEGIERFASAAQGVGDLANQHVVLGVLLFWRWLFFEGDSAAQRYAEARSVTLLSEKLWTLAGEIGARATHNDGAIRYLLYLAGLKERLRIAELVTEKRRVPKDEEIRRRLEMEIDRLEQDYGLTYEIGWESTIRDVGIFVSEVKRRLMDKTIRRLLSEK